MCTLISNPNLFKIGRGGKGTGKRTRSSKRLNGDQALTDHTEPTVIEEVSQPDTVPMNGEGLNRDNNIEEYIGSNLSKKDIVVALFGVLLSSIEDLDVLTRKIEAGDYDELKNGMTSDEWKSVIGEIKAE
ncbi:hypothetical protein Tco_0624036 [Tanacetum coccineum]|uniref:Uncharacterized protein n=1 Tax=Tanacetum coccineum TaxID=301880 RepID=A0ABQ4WCU8_9ASTR